MNRRRLGQPEDDEEWFDVIKDELLSAIDYLAEQDAAAAWSTLGDQDLMDIEEAGYDDQSAIAIATFGKYSTAVGGDVLVDPFWEEELKIPKEKHPQLWTDVGTRQLLKWLRENDYEPVYHRVGGRVPDVEEEVWLEHVIRHVAHRMDIAEDVVERVMASLCKTRDVFCGYDGKTAYTSVSGDVEVWAIAR